MTRVSTSEEGFAGPVDVSGAGEVDFFAMGWSVVRGWVFDKCGRGWGTDQRSTLNGAGGNAPRRGTPPTTAGGNDRDGCVGSTP